MICNTFRIYVEISISHSEIHFFCFFLEIWERKKYVLAYVGENETSDGKWTNEWDRDLITQNILLKKRKNRFKSVS